MKKILIIGSRGYVGSYLFDYLRKKSLEVTGIDNNLYGNTFIKNYNNNTNYYIIKEIENFQPEGRLGDEQPEQTYNTTDINKIIEFISIYFPNISTEFNKLNKLELSKLVYLDEYESTKDNSHEDYECFANNQDLTEYKCKIRDNTKMYTLRNINN